MCLYRKCNDFHWQKLESKRHGIIDVIDGNSYYVVIFDALSLFEASTNEHRLQDQ